MSNIVLKQACIEWLQTTVSFLSTAALGFSSVRQYTFYEDGHYERSKSGKKRSVKFDYMQFFRYRTELFGSSAFTKVAEVVRQIPAASTILFADFTGGVPLEVQKQDEMLGHNLAIFLQEYHIIATEKYSSIEKGFTFDSDIFDAIYTKFEQYIFSSEPFPSIWLVHFRNLYLGTDKIQLDRGLILRRTTDEEKTEELNRRWLGDLPPYTYLEIHGTIDRFTQPDKRVATQIAEAVVLALRLIKPNPIDISSYQWVVPSQPFRQLIEEKEWINHRFADLQTISPSDLRTIDGEKYILEEDDVRTFPKLLKQLMKPDRDAELSTAITRFEDSYLRTQQKDKLIDYWVALEAVFLSLIDKDFVNAMSDTVASNVAYYIGKTESERRSIFNKVQESHQIRGYFIHGERGKKRKNVNLDLKVKETEQILRQALRKRIEE